MEKVWLLQEQYATNILSLRDTRPSNSRKDILFVYAALYAMTVMVIDSYHYSDNFDWFCEKLKNHQYGYMGDDNYACEALANYIRLCLNTLILKIPYVENTEGLAECVIMLVTKHTMLFSKSYDKQKVFYLITNYYFDLTELINSPEKPLPQATVYTKAYCTVKNA